jgi:hypothetical protein
MLSRTCWRFPFRRRLVRLISQTYTACAARCDRALVRFLAATSEIWKGLGFWRQGTDAAQVTANIISSQSQALGEAAGAAATRTAVPVMRESDGLTMTLSDLAPAPVLQRVCKICCCPVGGDAYFLF